MADDNNCSNLDFPIAALLNAVHALWLQIYLQHFIKPHISMASV